MSKARDLADSAQEINILDGKSFLDEDNLASNSATGIASQQSIKAYVDGITTTNITSTGALNSGSITSGFGNINNGSSTITTTGAISGGSFVIGSADINENDLESIDGITAGTVAASKAVVVNANKDITGFRNLTATGTISGTLSGAIASTTTATTQAESDDSTKVATTAYVVDKITTLIGGAPSTLNDLNELAAAINDDANYNSTLTTALATKLPLAGGTMTGNVTFGDNNKAIFGAGSDLEIYHDGSNSYINEIADGDLLIRTNGSGIRLQKNDGQNMVKALTGGAVQLYHNNQDKLATTSTGIQVTGNIANASGDLTLDVAGDIILDADGGDIKFKDGGTAFGGIFKSGNDLYLQSDISDGDIKFYGSDGGSTITALTLDMSDAGTAIFNHDAQFPDGAQVRLGADNDLKLHLDGTTAIFGAQNGDMLLDSAADIILDADGGDVFLKNAGTTFASFTDNSGHLDIFVPQTNGDIYFKGNDGGSTITALTLDMSDAGHARFNYSVSLVDNAKLNIGNGADIQIYHDGSNSYIDDQGAGSLRLRSNRLRIEKYTGENMIEAHGDGAVELYHNNAKKIETTSSGVTVTGRVAATSYTGDGSSLTGVGSTTYNAVGTYVWGYTSDTGYVEGDTKGSGIFPAGFIDTARTSANAGFQHGNPSYMTRGGTACSGTWRAMGRSNSDSAYQRPRPTLWVRIS